MYIQSLRVEKINKGNGKKYFEKRQDALDAIRLVHLPYGNKTANCFVNFLSSICHFKCAKLNFQRHRARQKTMVLMEALVTIL
jgi:hypothetical protein